jgi:hypothetical protein
VTDGSGQEGLHVTIQSIVSMLGRPFKVSTMLGGL